MIVKEEKKVSCYHCGEDCLDEHLQKNDKNFCCNGCLTVFELLEEHDLCDYYSLEQAPGIKIDIKNSEKFTFLDNIEIQKSLLIFQDEHISKVKFRIPSIHCSSCIWLLENLKHIQSGIISSHINFLKKEVTLVYNNGTISMRGIAEMLYSIGYEPDIKLENSNKKKKVVNHSLSLKIGISGFCFGNIMLLSFPEYLTGIGESTITYTWLFSYLSLILSLPVFFYSSSDYFVSAYKGLKAKMVNIDVPVSLGILTLFVRSTFDIVSQSGPGYFDSMTGLVFFLLIGKWFQNRTYQSLSFEKDYKSYFPIAVTKIVEDKELITPVGKINKGDVLRIRNEELIPCDGYLMSDNAEIDYSFVTGESMSVTKFKNQNLFAGGKAIGTSFLIKSSKKVSESYLVELWNQEAFKKNKNKTITSIIDVISKYFTLIVIGIALFSGLFWYVAAPEKIWNVVTAVLIVACPCALALSVPFTYGNTTRLFGKNGFFMKNSNSIEKLPKASVIVFDKTGTITDRQKMQLEYQGIPLTEKEISAIRNLTKESLHPLSRSIYDHLETHKTKNQNVINYKEISGKGIMGEIDGDFYQVGSENWIKKTEQKVSEGSIYIAINHKVKGFFKSVHVYRNNLTEMFQKFSEHHDLYILSGDNEREKNRLAQLVPNCKKLLFNQSPFDKLNFIKKLQSEGKTVIMVGDGLNDAGALKQSDFGISIAEDIHHFSPSCDAILNASSFPLLNQFFAFSKTAFQIVKASFVISFLYNFIGISFAIQGLLSPLIAAILMPLSSITVVSFITLAVYVLSKQKSL